MNYKHPFPFILLLLLSCTNQKQQEAQDSTKANTIAYNQALADELERMAEVDQIAAYIPQGEYKKLSLEEWNAFKDSVFTTHQVRLKEMFDTYGFVGLDLAGKAGSKNFWLMVQHSDHDPAFQKVVLNKMKVEVDKGNANASNYGLLVDRVGINTENLQTYGTQVTYNMSTAQAYPKPLKDSNNVNERRQSIGLEPLEAYLNSMSTMHFEMNKDNYLKKGVTEAPLYELKEQ